MRLTKVLAAAVVVGAGVAVSAVGAGAAATVVTATSIVGNPNPAVFGQTVRFTAGVGHGVVVPGTPLPTGTVTFFMSETACVSGVVCGTAVTSKPLPPTPPDSVSFTATGLPVGTHYFQAVYSGDATYRSSVSPSYAETIKAAGSGGAGGSGGKCGENKTTTCTPPPPTPPVPSPPGPPPSVICKINPSAPGCPTLPPPPPPPGSVGGGAHSIFCLLHPGASGCPAPVPPVPPGPGSGGQKGY
jgi:hypothetical protein